MLIDNVISSWMDQIQYDAHTARAVLTMKVGTRYIIHNLSPQTHREFLRAHSTGRYFNRWIRPFHTIERL